MWCPHLWLPLRVCVCVSENDGMYLVCGRERSMKKEQQAEKACVRTYVCVRGCMGVCGGLPTYLKRGMEAAICFSFSCCSVVFQQWQASEWKLALTSNYILPACQGLWDYRVTGLQSALSFCTLILSFPRFHVFTLSLLLDLPHSVVQLSFSHFSPPWKDFLCAFFYYLILFSVCCFDSMAASHS